MKKTLAALLGAALFVQCVIPDSLYAQEKTQIKVDVAHPLNTGIKPIWAFFGYDEANYTYMKDGKKLLGELAALSPVPVFVRTHNLLTSGDGIPALKWSSTNAYTETTDGKPVYNWKLADSVFDTYIRLHMKPLAQVSFMPEALSAKPESDGVQTLTDGKKIKHYTGWNQPPRDYAKFATLVNEWVKHCIARYGRKEVESWYWEIWNEPDISYWRGTQEEYNKLYDYSSDAIKRALPTAKVGGPETTNPNGQKAAEFLKAFLTHVATGINAATGKPGVPLDFITFHAKGDPKVIDGKVWMNIGRQLDAIDKGFQIVASYPTLKNLPIIIGESDPEGCAACSEDNYPQNAYRNGTMYAVYTAESFARIPQIAANRKVNLLGAVTWGFEFEDQPWFRGFRDLATNGVDKPVLNVFRMMGMMNGEQVPVTVNSPYTYQSIIDSSVRKDSPDINGMATLNGRNAYVMVWNYHDKNDLDVPAAPVTISADGINASRVNITEYRIDQSSSNSFTAWKQMGSPQHPTASEYKKLEESGHLTGGNSSTFTVTNHHLDLNESIPRQGVYLYVLSW
jgi:xylan 1,4-beta-xylosidase